MGVELVLLTKVGNGNGACVSNKSGKWECFVLFLLGFYLFLVGLAYPGKGYCV